MRVAYNTKNKDGVSKFKCHKIAIPLIVRELRWFLLCVYNMMLIFHRKYLSNYYRNFQWNLWRWAKKNWRIWLDEIVFITSIDIDLFLLTNKKMEQLAPVCFQILWYRDTAWKKSNNAKISLGNDTDVTFVVFSSIFVFDRRDWKFSEPCRKEFLSSSSVQFLYSWSKYWESELV